MYRTESTSTPLDRVDQGCSMYDSCICTFLSMYILCEYCKDSWAKRVLLGNNNRDSAHDRLHIGTQQRRRNTKQFPNISVSQWKRWRTSTEY